MAWRVELINVSPEPLTYENPSVSLAPREVKVIEVAHPNEVYGHPQMRVDAFENKLSIGLYPEEITS